MDSSENSFDWQEASNAAADAMNLLRMHPSRIGLEARSLRASLNPSAVNFRSAREDDRLSILLLVDDPADAMEAFADRHQETRARDAVAEVAGEVVGYCGIEWLGDREIVAFRVTDPLDRRAGAIETAIAHQLESWQRELDIAASGRGPWHPSLDRHPIGSLHTDHGQGRNAA